MASHRTHGKYGYLYFDAAPEGATPGQPTAFSPSIVLGLKSWERSGEADVAEASGTDSGGVKEYLPGMLDSTYAVEAVWDFGESKLKGLPPKICEGNWCRIVAGVRAASSALYSNYGIVKSTRVSVGIDGCVTWSMTIQSTGSAAAFPS
jgi:hypothetical protein